MRLLLLAALVLLLLVALLSVDLSDQALDHDSLPVKTVQQWGHVNPPYVIAQDMFTTTTTARARTAPSKRTVHALSVSAGVSDETWDRIAACESGGRWDDTRGGYEGGLHFAHDTWLRAGGGQYAEHAYQATRRQQIDVANSWLARTSWSQWPVCSRKVGVR